MDGSRGSSYGFASIDATQSEGATDLLHTGNAQYDPETGRYLTPTLPPPGYTDPNEDDSDPAYDNRYISDFNTGPHPGVEGVRDFTNDLADNVPGYGTYKAKTGRDMWGRQVSTFDRAKGLLNDALTLLPFLHHLLPSNRELEPLWRFFGKGCFVAGTPVALADGGFKPIEQVRAGDWVLSRNEAGNKNGKIEAQRVVQTSVRYNILTLSLCFANGETIETTAEHPFYVEGVGFVPAGRLCIGNAIVTRAGPVVLLTGLFANSVPRTVYNFTVAGDHTYFVGNYDGGLWVHNNETCYRETFFAAHPHLNQSDYIVHHSIEQQVLKRYPGLFMEAQIHALDNLRGIRRSINSRLHLSAIRQAWNNFYRRNPSPTREQVQGFARAIDDFFGSQFTPRR